MRPAWIALSAGLLIGAAPWEAPPSVAPVWLSDARPKAPLRRIVTVAPSLTELLFALGAGDRVVAVSRYDEHPESVKSLPKVGGFLDPNPEAIAGARPDVVLAVPNAGNRPALERVARLSIPVYVVPGNTFADVFHALRAVGALLGGEAEARARELERKLERDLKALSTKLEGLRRPKVAVVYGWDPLVLGGPSSFAGTMIDVLRAENVVKGDVAYPHYSLERLLVSGPEVIIDTTSEHIATGRAPWRAWTTVPAVRDGRVHAVSLGGVLRPGPHIVEGLRKLARLFHPDAFDGEATGRPGAPGGGTK